MGYKNSENEQKKEWWKGMAFVLITSLICLTTLNYNLSSEFSYKANALYSINHYGNCKTHE